MLLEQGEFVNVSAVCVPGSNDLTTSADVLSRAAGNRNHDGCVGVNLYSAKGINAVSLSDHLTAGQGEDQGTQSSFFRVVLLL